MVQQSWGDPGAAGGYCRGYRGVLQVMMHPGKTQERLDLSRSCLLREVQGQRGFGSCSQSGPESPELSRVRIREV